MRVDNTTRKQKHTFRRKGRAGKTYTYIVCRCCRKEVNISRMQKVDKNYICPVCIWKGGGGACMTSKT